MFRQRAVPMNSKKEFVCWDYHVIVIKTINSSTSSDVGNKSANNETYNTSWGNNDGRKFIKTEVLDIDTWLTPYPCPFEQYLDETFPHVKDVGLDPKYLPLFR